MAPHPELEDETMRTAAIWWTNLRAPDPSADMLERWEAWMAADPAHAQAFAQLNALSEAVASAPMTRRRELIEEFAPRTASLGRRRWIAVAALFAMALLGGWWTLRGGLDLVRPSRQYVSTIGENREIKLPDGTVVQLGAASTLATRYAGNRRDIELGDGEAFFTVTHDGNRPFVVAAGPLRIEDIGTAFNVRRTGKRVSVAVTEGHVRLSLADAATHDTRRPSGGLDLLAGQRAEYDPGSGALSVSEVSVEHAAAWRENRLEFVNEPLAIVVANVNRYSRQPVQFSDPRLGKLMFTGTVNTTTIDSWVDALPHIFPVQVSTFADHVVLSSTRQP